MKEKLYGLGLIVFIILFYQYMRHSKKKRIEFFNELTEKYPNLSINDAKTTVSGQFNGYGIRIYELSGDATIQCVDLFHGLAIEEDDCFTIETKHIVHKLSPMKPKPTGLSYFDDRYYLDAKDNSLGHKVITEAFVNHLKEVYKYTKHSYCRLRLTKDKLSAEISGETYTMGTKEAVYIYMDALVKVMEVIR